MEGGTCLSRGKFLTADNAQLYHFRLDEDEREREIPLSEIISSS